MASPAGLGLSRPSVYLYRYAREVSDAATQWPVWAIIREARHRAGLSQAELAERAGTSQPAIARYEGARAMPELATLYRIVEGCGLRLDLRLVEADAQREATEQAALDRNVEERLLANDAHTHLVAELRRG